MTPVPPKVRAEVEARSGGLCERCGTRWARTLHHKLPRSAGGAHSADNLAHLCAFDGFSEGCHERVHANPAESYREGWLIRRSA